MASISSVTTRGYGLSGGFAGSASLVVTLGYGLGVDSEHFCGDVTLLPHYNATVRTHPKYNATVGLIPTYNARVEAREC